MPDEVELAKLHRFRVFLSSPYRIAIMSALEVRGYMRFSELARFLGASVGNTAYHLKVLEKNGAIRVLKAQERNNISVIYEMTEDGKREFREFLSLLRRVIET